TGRRLADQIIDVMTEELTLRAVDDPPTKPAAHSPPLPPSERLTCLNQTAVLAMCVAFVMTILLSTVLVLYLLRDVCRGWMRSPSRIEHYTADSVLSRCSTNSTDSMDRRSDLPIFARRLGEPNYVMTARSY
ncbi:hypothetical protein GCK32_020418, partial [Trichostrongylus colubriformis]